jgi:hypothetical protein
MKNEEKEYCLVSKEILLCIEWILLYDTKLFENLIKKIWKNGFEKIYFEELEKKEKLEDLDPQQTILDFFSLLENSINRLAKKDIKIKNDSINQVLSTDFSIILDNYIDYKGSIEKSLLQSIQESEKELSLESEDNKVLLEKNSKNILKNKFYKHFLQNWDPENTLVE